MQDCFIIGAGATVPGTSLGEWLSGAPVAPDDYDPLNRLERRKLRYKDRATVLALSAVQAALNSAGICANPRIADFERTGVVAASNFGNLDTVCRAVECIAAQGASDTSPLDLPNASPNVVAASIAIYFGAGALNMMVTSGKSAGLDAIALAVRALRAGRADRMIVVGAESASSPVRQLFSEVGDEIDDSFEGAGALILSNEPSVRPNCVRIVRETRSDTSAQCFILDNEIRATRPMLLFGAHREIAELAYATKAIEEGKAMSAQIEAPGVGLRIVLEPAVVEVTSP